MKIEMIEEESNKRLEEISVERNKSKGAIALEICEFFFGRGVPHLKNKKALKKSTAA
jgi:hypothetical protein